MIGPLELLRDLGGSRYDGEPVTQLDHALQTAALADDQGAPDALIVAALLHDVGHLLSAAGDRHAHIGARYLHPLFGPAVSEPVRLHVEAKRYLCRDPAYLAGLSAESTRSLAAQGGPMHDADAQAFLAESAAGAAIRLRRWDDAAKVVGASVPSLGAWVPLLDRVRHRDRPGSAQEPSPR